MPYRELRKIYYDRDTRSQYETIYHNRIQGESTIVFDFLIKGNPAFIVLNNELVNLLWDISLVDKEVKNLQNLLPNIALSQFTFHAMVEEIKLTNDIEGVYSTRKEIVSLIDIVNNAESARNRNRLFGMVYKYSRLMQNESIRFDDCDDIRNLYNDFVLNEVKLENPDNVPDGKYFRKNPVSVYSKSDIKIHDGVFPEDQINYSMDRALRVLNDADVNILIRTAVFHYMFGYIHPFYDGNGRMSRFISSYMLSKAMDSLVHFRLSYIIKNNITIYYRLFKNANDIRNRGDLTQFVMGFLNFILLALEDLRESINDRCNTYSDFIEPIGLLLSNTKERDVLFILVQNALFGIRGLDFDSLLSVSKKKRSTLLKILKKLGSEMGLLRIEKEGKKFLYSVNLDALSEKIGHASES